MGGCPCWFARLAAGAAPRVLGEGNADWRGHAVRSACSRVGVPPVTAPAERLLSARELAELLGFAPGTVLDWFEVGRLPGFKIGTAVRFRASEVEAWLETQRVGAVSP